MRTLLISILVFLVAPLSAQQDYFYAQTLIDNGQSVQAVRVLDHLIDSGAYADRPRFAMMTLNLAGTTKEFLQDTAGAAQCFVSAIACYDTLRAPLKSDNSNHREYYKACENLAWIYYYNRQYSLANSLLLHVGPPGEYYSSTGTDVLAAHDGYYAFRCKIFQKLNLPDSAFTCIRKMRDAEYTARRQLDSTFDIATNSIQHIAIVPFKSLMTDQNCTMAGYLYFVAWKDAFNQPQSVWFVNYDSRGLEIIGWSSGKGVDLLRFPQSPVAMCLSADEKYLAVENQHDSASWIELLNFGDLIGAKTFKRENSISPGPGACHIVKWEKGALLIESNSDLTRLNKKNRLGSVDLFGNPEAMQIYAFDPESGKYTKK